MQWCPSCFVVRNWRSVLLILVVGGGLGDGRLVWCVTNSIGRLVANQKLAGEDQSMFVLIGKAIIQEQIALPLVNQLDLRCVGNHVHFELNARHAVEFELTLHISTLRKMQNLTARLRWHNLHFSDFPRFAVGFTDDPLVFNPIRVVLVVHAIDIIAGAARLDRGNSDRFGRIGTT